MARGKYQRWMSEEGQKQLAEWAATQTDEELARSMGIAQSTFYKWQPSHPEIAGAIERGRTGALAEKAVETVEASLFERCVGGVHEVAKAVKIKTVEYDEATGRRIRETERVELAKEQVYVPADTAAIKFFLTNRAPDRWKNRTDLTAETTEGVEAFLKSLGGGEREF